MYPETIPPLLRVARRVLVWIEPLLYRVIRIDKMALVLRRVMETKEPGFFASGVRHIYLGHSRHWSREHTRALLQLCTNIVSLAYIRTLGEPALLEILTEVRGVRRWSGRLEDLFENPSAIRLDHPVFRTVTHMDAFDGLNSTTSNALISVALPAMPALTHVCLNKSIEANTLRRLLEQCPHLKALVGMWSSGLGVEPRAAGVTDVRYVVAVCNDYWSDWEVGVRGGKDFWAAADEFIARKQRGEIEESCIILDEW
ncbi:hypothetical protein DFH06DRAFT_565193 [Mycena polygramma]|nr:hypothetical protein DFH06DRAFT_565193 [Mycena polygramma]